MVLVAALHRARPERIWVIVASGPDEAEHAAADLEGVLGEGTVSLYPQRESLPYEAAETHLEIGGLRVEALEALLAGRASILVTTVTRDPGALPRRRGAGRAPDLPPPGPDPAARRAREATGVDGLRKSRHGRGGGAVRAARRDSGRVRLRLSRAGDASSSGATRSRRSATSTCSASSPLAPCRSCGSCRWTCASRRRSRSGAASRAAARDARFSRISRRRPRWSTWRGRIRGANGSAPGPRWSGCTRPSRWWATSPRTPNDSSCSRTASRIWWAASRVCSSVAPPRPGLPRASPSVCSRPSRSTETCRASVRSCATGGRRASGR